MQVALNVNPCQLLQYLSRSGRRRDDKPDGCFELSYACSFLLVELGFLNALIRECYPSDTPDAATGKFLPMETNRGSLLV
jgi:hypothetical protein